jgi:glycosyltransferase involved in cell wall biosynthesis
MILVGFSLLLSVTVELLAHAFSPTERRGRLIFAGLSLPASIFAATTVLIWSHNLFGIGIVTLFLYRLFNMARVIKGRMHEQYLWRVTFRTSLWLILGQLLLVGLAWTWARYQPVPIVVLKGLLFLQLIAAMVFSLTVNKHARTMRQAAVLDAVHDGDLPSLTVAIPARNETADLHDCITALLNSHYPKLEIIVLDDCSQTRRTPDIIRSFAHDGVRFIHGEEPRDTWLAKNQAYDTLAQSANGEWIIFMGVDIRVEPNTLRQLVAYAQQKKKSMLCVMPRNILQKRIIPLIQPMRYVWELALPRRWVNRPPVLSSFWMITKRSLEQYGGFQAAARMVVPEAYFANCASQKDMYSFITSSDTFGITSLKNLSEQRDTAIRVAYPQTHRKPQIVWLLTISYALWVGLPLIALVHSLIAWETNLSLLLAAAVLFCCAWLYIMIFKLAYGKIPFMAITSLPIAALIYVGLLNYSMYKYEFSEVIWKGRNVCLPVMHVVPHLPKI